MSDDRVAGGALFAEGLKIRRAVLGPDYVDQSLARADEFMMAIQNIAKKWTMPIHNWKPALNCFAIEFADRFPND